MLVFVKLEPDFLLRWCVGRRIGHLLFATHPRHSIREWLYVPVPCLRILAAVNLYLPLQHLVPGNKPQGGD
jgi:hypothetical protein